MVSGTNSRVTTLIALIGVLLGGNEFVYRQIMFVQKKFVEKLSNGNVFTLRMWEIYHSISAVNQAFNFFRVVKLFLASSADCASSCLWRPFYSRFVACFTTPWFTPVTLRIINAGHLTLTFE
jgi:hypothetical protein